MTDGGIDPRAVEALLFLSPEPLSADALADILEVDREEVLAALDRVAERFDEGSGLELAPVAGGWTLRTRADLEDVCDRLRQRPPEDRLSPAALETLAVVAYLEPVSRPDISRLRGVSVDSTVANLVERGLLEEAGRGDGATAMRYRTTRAFQKRFGLADRRDLPPIERFELSGAQAEDLRRTLIDSGHLAPDTVAPGDGDDEAAIVRPDTGDADPADGGGSGPSVTEGPALTVASGPPHIVGQDILVSEDTAGEDSDADAPEHLADAPPSPGGAADRSDDRADPDAASDEDGPENAT